jgi:hypothetical protein
MSTRSRSPALSSSQLVEDLTVRYLLRCVEDEDDLPVKLKQLLTQSLNVAPVGNDWLPSLGTNRPDIGKRDAHVRPEHRGLLVTVGQREPGHRVLASVAPGPRSGEHRLAGARRRPDQREWDILDGLRDPVEQPPAFDDTDRQPWRANLAVCRGRHHSRLVFARSLRKVRDTSPGQSVLQYRALGQ